MVVDERTTSNETWVIVLDDDLGNECFDDGFGQTWAWWHTGLWIPGFRLIGLSAGAQDGGFTSHIVLIRKDGYPPNMLSMSAGKAYYTSFDAFHICLQFPVTCDMCLLCLFRV